MAKNLKAVFLALAIMALSCAAASAAEYTFDPDPANIYDLDHSYYYSWGIDFTIPDNEQLDGASLSFSGIYNWEYEADDVLFVHLLDDAAAGVASFYDNQAGGDNFDGQGVKLFEYTDTTDLVAENFSYTFTQDQVNSLSSALSNGNFGLGFDPDCHYFNDGVQMKITTKVVPEPVSCVLFLAGAGALAGARKLRRRA